MSSVVRVILVGDDASLQRALARTQAASSKTAATLRGLDAVGTKLTRAGSALTTVGRNVTHGVTIPVLAAGAAAVKMAFDYDTAMTKIRLLTDGGRKNAAMYSAEIMKMAKVVGKSPTELANGLYYIASSGYQGADALKILNASAKAAAIGLGQTQTITDYVTTALSLFKDKGLTAAGAVDILTMAVQKGKGEPAAYAEQLGKILGSAKLAGVGIADVVAAVTQLTNEGQAVDKATTSIDNIFGVIAKPSAAGLKMMQALGLSAKELRKELADKGIMTTLKDINSHIHGQSKIDPTTAVNTLFANKRASRGFNALTQGDQGQTKDTFSSIANSAGATAAKFAEWANSMQGKFHTAMGVLMSDLTAVGGRLLPTLVDWLHKGVTWFHNLDPETLKSAGRFLGLAAAMGPVLLVGGKLLTTFGLIAKHPIITALVILAAKFAHLYSTNENFRRSVNGLVGDLKPLVAWVSQHRKGLERVAGAILTYAAAVRVAEGATKAWTAANALWAASFGGPATAIAAVALAVVYCYTEFDNFRYKTNAVIGGFYQIVFDMAHGVLKAVDVMLQAWSYLPDWMGGGKANGAHKAIQGLMADIDRAEKNISAVFPTSREMEIRVKIDQGLYDNAAKALARLNIIGPKPASLYTSAAQAAHNLGEHVSGARAAGGPVSAGGTYLVGEHGPELYTFGASGMVHSAAATAAMFGPLSGNPGDAKKIASLTKTYNTQKLQADNAAHRYQQLLSRRNNTIAEKQALENAKRAATQQKAQADAAKKALDSARHPNAAGLPLLNKAAALVSGAAADLKGPIEKGAAALADSIKKQFADKDGNVPAAAQAAIDRLNDLASQAQSARQAFVGSLTGSSDFVSKFSGTAASSGDITAFLQGQVAKIGRLGADLKILAARGLPASMLQQLAAGGLDALPVADALVRSNSADLAQIVSLQNKINNLSNALGDSTQGAVFGGSGPQSNLTGTLIKDAPAGSGGSSVTVNVQTNADPYTIASEVAWTMKTASA